MASCHFLKAEKREFFCRCCCQCFARARIEDACSNGNDMPSLPVNPYDRVPYPSNPIHAELSGADGNDGGVAVAPGASGGNRPRAGIGFLFGWQHHAAGGAISDARFVGMDSSGVEIKIGRRHGELLGLNNIELRHGDILEVDASWGEFDYIICHGVYSWVARKIQDKILAIVAQLLSPDGIAFVSYNAYPGWHGRGIVRELMRFRALRFEDARQQIREARDILQRVTSVAQELADEPYRLLLHNEKMILGDRSDEYLYHEHLGEHFEPVYFSDFVQRVRAHGLEYLGEPALSAMATARGGLVERELSAFTGDRIELEQWSDFCTNRAYRATLLRRPGRPPVTDLRASAVWPMYVASGARPTAPVDLTCASVTTFRNEAGDQIEVSLPLLKAALLELADHWRAAVPFESLLDSAARRLNVAVSDIQRTILGRAILTAMTYSRAMEVSVEPSRFSVCPGQFPMTARDMRIQAELGSLVANCRHELIELSESQRKILRALDGTRAQNDVAAHTGSTLDEVRREVERLARLALLGGVIFSCRSFCGADGVTHLRARRPDFLPKLFS